jgi:RHS repeat-associated protein
VPQSGATEHRHYLGVPGMTAALFTTRSSGTSTTATLRYMHHDHLGSVAAISNEAGSIVERLAYDPWGKRRFPNGLPDSQDAIVGLNTERGYTMHEHLDEVGVIHMNGRIFDPLIGRFMSADPYTQAPGNLQSFNRYAYVMNNPLAYTDPSGYWSLRRSLKKLFKNKVFRAVAAIAIGFYAPGLLANYGFTAPAWMSPTMITATNGAAAGFAAGLVSSGGDLKAGLQGALSGGLFAGIGSAADIGKWGDAARIGAHAAAGCVTAEAAGGSCGAGAAGAAFGKFATLYGPGWVQNPQGFGEVAAGVAYTAVSGGIASTLAGGKFANGAETAAYGYLFNQVQTVMRHAFSSNLRNANGDIGHTVVKNASDGLQNSVELGRKGIEICGLGHAACRGADFGISLVESVAAANKGDWSVAAGNAAGFGVGKWAEGSVSALKVYPQQFVQGVGHAYDKISGKLTEHVFRESQKPQK